MKRQRGRGRKPGGGGGHQGNRPFESNGPDVKIRGTAAQIYEKYAQYARDAQSSGDRVKYENYLQHAEHYFRIMAATMPRDQRPPMQGVEGGGQPMNQGEERDGEEVSADPMKVVDDGADEGDDGFEGDDVEGSDEEEAQASGGQDDRGDGQGQGRGRRRRGRRRHHEGQGGGQGGQQGQGGQGGQNNGERNDRPDTEARSALDSLARKQGALAGG
jgi:hypothetical protein